MKFQNFRHDRTCAVIHGFLCVGMMVYAFFFPTLAWSKDPSELQTVQLFFENDLFSGTDEYYTNAIQITWLSTDLNRYVGLRDVHK